MRKIRDLVLTVNSCPFLPDIGKDISVIPINIRNTNAPEDAGTMIVEQAEKGGSVVTGIAGKKGFGAIYIEKGMMNGEVGFVRRALEVLERFGVSFEHFPSGIDTMTFVVATDSIANIKNDLISEIFKKTAADSVIIEDGMALVAVVGRGMVRAKGTAARVFNAISHAGINIKMIDQGSSELNIIIGIEEQDYEITLNAIYHEFY